MESLESVHTLDKLPVILPPELRKLPVLGPVLGTVLGDALAVQQPGHLVTLRVPRGSVACEHAPLRTEASHGEPQDWNTELRRGVAGPSVLWDRSCPSQRQLVLASGGVPSPQQGQRMSP